MYYKHYQDITAEEIEKEWALIKHNSAYGNKDTYALPYRIMLDLVENESKSIECENRSEYVPLNEYYPFEEVPPPGEWDFEKDGHYTDDEWLLLTMERTGRFDEQGREYVNFFVIPPQIQALIDEKGKPYRLWDLGTAAGFNTWIYFFMVFLMPYETKIQGFTMFDMYGDTKHSEQDLKERKAYYTELIERCKAMPELYKHDIQIRSNPLDILYHERDMIPNYDLEREDTNTRAYRIGEVLKLLETAA